MDGEEGRGRENFRRDPSDNAEIRPVPFGPNRPPRLLLNAVGLPTSAGAGASDRCCGGDFAGVSLFIPRLMETLADSKNSPAKFNDRPRTFCAKCASTVELLARAMAVRRNVYLNNANLDTRECTTYARTFPDVFARVYFPATNGFLGRAITFVRRRIPSGLDARSAVTAIYG